MDLTDKYEVVIGLEVHAQLLTKSKLFCGDSTSFGSPPNTQVSVISLAHPGTLPKLNKHAVELAVKIGLACNCNIQYENFFARKNYFYPDLPKGFQVSQHTVPICKDGEIWIVADGKKVKIELNRIHIEEDAGKSIHDVEADFSCIDYNRAGVALVEIVTEPCIRTSDEAFSFLTQLRALVRWYDICDGNMEEGSFRCDANISVRLKGDKSLGIKVEVKNLNSIRNVKRAIEIEKERLIGLHQRGEKIIQETRSFDADNQSTFTLREKEEANDYRYFPEPDLPPFIITNAFIDKIRSSMLPSPEELQLQFQEGFGLSEYDSCQLVGNKETALFFLEVSKYHKGFKSIANWITGPIRQYINDHGVELSTINLRPGAFAELIALVDSNQVSFSQAASKMLPALLEDDTIMVGELATRLNLLQTSTHIEIESWVKQVIKSLPDKVTEYKKGKKGLIGLFVGEVKKISKGKADPKQVTLLLEKELND